MSILLKLTESRWALGAVFILSLIVKSALLLADKTINTDGILYITAAKYFEAGDYEQGWALFRMPAYPFLLHLVNTVIPDWVLAARSISILAYTAAILPLYGLTRALFDHKSAVWAAILFALSPLVNIKSMDVIRDPVFILLMATYLYSLLEGIRKRSHRSVLAAFFFGALSFLFRIEALVLLGVPLIYFGLLRLKARREDVRRWSLAALGIWFAALVVTALLALGIMQFTWHDSIVRSGEIRWHLRALASLSAFENYQAIYAQLKYLQQNPPFSGGSSSIAALSRHWMPLVYLFGQLVILLKVLFPVFLIPLIIGLKTTFTRENTHKRVLHFLSLLFCIYFLFIYYAYLIRDFLPSRLLFPLVFMLFAIMGRGMAEGLRSTLAASYPKITATVVVFFFLLAPIGRAADKTHRSDAIAKTAGLWLQEHQNHADQPLLTSEPKILFYADRIADYKQDRKACEKLKLWQSNEEFGSIEAYARRLEAHSIVILLKDRTKSPDTLFATYAPVKVFAGRKGRYVVFNRTNG